MSKVSTETLHAILLEMKDDLKEVKEQTKKTNGRVNTLEGRANKVDGSFAIIKYLIIALAIPIVLMLIERLL